MVDQISGVACPDCGVKVPLKKVNRHPVTLVTQVITRAYKKALTYFEHEILKNKV
jgi:DNA-directed RNA polymerase subunit RPC12/RpoP